MNYNTVRFIKQNLSPECEKVRTKCNLFLSYVGLSRDLLPLLRKLKETFFTGSVGVFFSL